MRRKWEPVLICGYEDARHFCLVSANRSRICWFGERLTFDECVRLKKQKTKRSVGSQWDVYALRTVVQNKQPEPKIKAPPPRLTHTFALLCSNPFTNTTSTLYTHSFMHTGSFTLSVYLLSDSFAEWLSTFTPLRMAFVVRTENLWFSPLISTQPRLLF